jgi:hypothetical protein
MRLYLSSSRMGNQPQELLPLVDDGRSLAVIANAIDGYEKLALEKGVALEMDHLCKLGFDALEVDLRQYFGKRVIKYLYGGPATSPYESHEKRRAHFLVATSCLKMNDSVLSRASVREYEQQASPVSTGE